MIYQVMFNLIDENDDEKIYNNICYTNKNIVDITEKLKEKYYKYTLDIFSIREIDGFIL